MVLILLSLFKLPFTKFALTRFNSASFLDAIMLFIFHVARNVNGIMIIAGDSKVASVRIRVVVAVAKYFSSKLGNASHSGANDLVFITLNTVDVRSKIIEAFITWFIPRIIFVGILLAMSDECIEKRVVKYIDLAILLFVQPLK